MAGNNTVLDFGGTALRAAMHSGGLARHRNEVAQLFVSHLLALSTGY